MRSRINPRARMIALAIGVGAVGSLATAPVALATAPAAGINCQAQDGKITGRGSTFAEAAMWSVLIPGFQTDVCGTVAAQSPLTGNTGGTIPPNTWPAIGDTTDPAGTGQMIDYNDYAGCGTTNPTTAPTTFGTACHATGLFETNKATGSGAGQEAIKCRSDAYGGSDIPYTEAQLTILKAAPTTANCGTQSATGTVSPGSPNPEIRPPYALSASGTYPATGDTSAGGMMSFPIAGGAITFGVNLATSTSDNTTCTLNSTNGGSAFGAPVNLTLQDLENIWDATYTNWNGGDLWTNTPLLATDNCTGPINRVARLDNSGTTSLVMELLNHVDGQQHVCGVSTNKSWGVNVANGSSQSSYGYTNNPNNVWPTCTGGGTGQPTEASGTDGVISTTQATSGSIGYAEIGKWNAEKISPNPIGFASLQDAADFNSNTVGTYIAPSVGACALSGNLPGSSASDAVGLNSGSANWGADAQLTSGTANVQDQTFQTSGAQYPDCGLTFDFVVRGAHIETTPNPLIGFTNDQRQTLYSFMLYLLSPGAQSNLAAQGYDQLPSGWLSTLRSGIVANF